MKEFAHNQYCQSLFIMIGDELKSLNIFLHFKRLDAKVTLTLKIASLQPIHSYSIKWH